ncbi:acetoacetate--CoA ligase [Tengunoibacter tsumagoiensis]|uniref:Acetoacetyl-CoA synthetase n=1 Tax=Tengunoibacter tsumagoiensis TaxID=2014871 RepID=A0A402A3G5_9CHLR|nr:acetoacetate--CoA ligase [Tengunoibacter tsumagoiensis]GCE13693.1 acetoacetyl-CoA synthetase [Tengunoibacter tsumagoiensis]
MPAAFESTRPLWQPSIIQQEAANITKYRAWLAQEKGLVFANREELWLWSVEQIEAFWGSLWDFFAIQASRPYQTVLVERKMPGAIWFPGAQLNYAEHIFRQTSPERPALLFQSEGRPLCELSWADLKRKVAAIAQTFRTLGVQRGDRVVAYLPNIPEAVIAFLACASLGAIWSSCSPDFGASSVIERFQQIEPRVLIAVDGYSYAGKIFDRRPILVELQQQLPTLQKTILIPYLDTTATTATGSDLTQLLFWQEALLPEAELHFEQVPFAYPLWVLYSSGTTGLPKAIVQSQGGILMEHLKVLALESDLKPGDRFFWFSTTGWMMWNLLVGSLLVGATALLYDGSPGYPDLNALWSFAHESGMTFFGTSASYLSSCLKAEIEPGQRYDLSQLRALGSTGSPLPPEGFLWVYEHVKSDLWLCSISGGTDVCSAFVCGSIVLPVYAGELQCRSLGAKVEAFDESGQSFIDEVGELVLTEPMPSMPLFFWNDPNNRRYLESYFAVYPGIWRHGDWIRITPRGSAIIYGRSDSTINRMGIRMGSSEIYRVVESFPEIVDSLIIGVEQAHGGYYLPLFVVLRPGAELDEDLKQRLRTALRTRISPHHIPDEILSIAEVPRTLSGKKLEVPIKKILLGLPVEKAISVDALSNPQAIHFFLELASKRKQADDKIGEE